MRIKYFLFGAAALALGACSSDENENISPSKKDAKEAYVQVTVKLPSADATRSATGTGGTTAEGVEIGQTSENTISKFRIVLVDANGKIANSDPISTGGNVPGSSDTYTTDPIKVTNLKAGATYTAYVVVNDANDAADMEDAYMTVTSADLTGSIAKANNFLMTGKGASTVTTANDVTAYTKESPLNLGTVSVERAVARFDYGAVKTNNVYELGATAGELTVTLTGIALTNVSPTFYTTKRVSVDGTDDASGSGWTLGGAETSTNYVVDYDFANKTYAKWHAGTKASFLNTYAAKTGTGVTYKDLSTLTTADNSWSSTGKDLLDYKIWTYCTENTIQADPTENQINGLSTGVIFKAEITGTMKGYKDTEAAFKATAGNKVYIFDGNVFGGWSNVVAFKNETDFSSITDSDEYAAMVALQTALKSAFVAQGLSETDDATLNTSAKLGAAGFTRYTADTEGKYYAYYTYWNRHNDNGVSNVMGPMEFAVVRNNVYKLAVTEIKRLGHPKDPTKPTPTGTDPEPDPDPEDPENPDEDPSIYLKVAVKVVPWTVRLNNISF